MKRRIQRAKDELSRISLNIKGEVVEKKSGFSLIIDKNKGNGEVKCINFDQGLYMMEFEINLKDTTYIPLFSEDNRSIYFIYCLEGNCYYSAQQNNHLVRLDELQTAIIMTRNNFTGGLVFDSGSSACLNIIRIDIDTYFEKHQENSSYISQKLKSFLSELSKKHNLVHFGKLNLEIGEYIKKLSKVKYTNNLSELLYFEGICILILAGHVDQYLDEINGKVNSSKLIKRELIKIMNLADEIKQEPEKPYSLKYLCSKSGLSASKLQEGFKFLHQNTVADFIRNMRLQKAEELLKETDMNISEVVYSVGLTSRSYFCKIFKERYNCTPKQYKTKSNLKKIGRFEND